MNNLTDVAWLMAVVLMVVVMVYALHRRGTLLHRIATARLLPRLTNSSSSRRRIRRVVTLLITLCLLVIALLDPRWGSSYKEVEQTGIDTFFVLDVSRSMLAEDVRPSRLHRAATAIRDVIEVIGSDRVGLITVAGDASLIVPLTLDYGSLQLSLEDVSPRSVNRGGTMIGDGIRLASRSFTDEIPDHKVIIVLSDGEDMGSFPIEAAADAANSGIKVYTVGIGDSSTGSRIPTVLYGQPSYVMYEGSEVWSVMNADELTEVANAGGGAFVPAGTANLDLASIYTERIATSAGRSFDSVMLEQFIPRFQWFAIPALLLLSLDSWMSVRAKSKQTQIYEVTS